MNNTFNHDENNNNGPTVSLTLPVLVFVSTLFIFVNVAQEAYSHQSITSTSQNLSNNLGNSTDAQIAVYQNNVYVVWNDATTGNGDIYFKRSADNGTSFGSIENLSNNLGNSTDAQIAVYQNNVYVVWNDATTGNGDIYFKRSADNGTTFDEPENVSENYTGSSSDPQLSANGSNVYIAWTETSLGNNEIFFIHSNDMGERFAGAKGISKTFSVDGESSLFPQISAIGNNVYVVWQEKVSAGYEIFLRESGDRGNKFGGIKNLSRNNTADSISPIIASSGNNVYIAWSDREPGRNEIFLRASNDNATTFGGIKNVSWSEGNSYDPRIAVAGNSSVYLLWEDSSFKEFTFDLIFRPSQTAANTFLSKVNIGRYIGETSDYGQIAAHDNNVFVVWSDAPRASYPPKYEIFLEASRDNGQSFDDGINLSTGQGNSINPQIAVSEKNKSIYVVWSEVTNGNSEIHFTKLENFF